MESAVAATLICGLLAFLGVIRTIHNENQKAREERAFLAKHKALLDAAQAALKFVNYYITLPDRELPRDGVIPEEVSGLGITFTTLHFYCDLETIKSSIRVNQMLGKAYATAVQAKMPSMFLAEDVKSIDLQIANLEKINVYLQNGSSQNQQGHNDAFMAFYDKQIEMNVKRLQELFEEKNAVILKKYQATESCRDVIFQELPAIYKGLSEIQLLARKELSFPINEKEYGLLINQATDAGFSMAKGMCDKIRAEVQQKIEPPRT